MTIDDLTELIPVDPDNPYPLGRAGVHHDPRNADHRALVQPPARATKPNRAWYTTDIYDQGRTYRCTAEAAIGCLRTHPNRSQFHLDWPSYDQPDERHALYLEAQSQDPWPGNNYNGSSTDAPFKVLRDRGHITGWKWLFGETEVREFVTWYGPAVVGTIWYSDMFTPDTTGYIHPTGSQSGGHAYRLIQHSAKRDAYRIANSWGRTWGQNGRAWIKSADLATLLAQDGEAVTIA